MTVKALVKIVLGIQGNGAFVFAVGGGEFAIEGGEEPLLGFGWLANLTAFFGKNRVGLLNQIAGIIRVAGQAHPEAVEVGVIPIHHGLKEIIIYVIDGRTDGPCYRSRPWGNKEIDTNELKLSF